MRSSKPSKAPTRNASIDEVGTHKPTLVKDREFKNVSNEAIVVVNVIPHSVNNDQVCEITIEALCSFASSGFYLQQRGVTLHNCVSSGCTVTVLPSGVRRLMATKSSSPVNNVRRLAASVNLEVSYTTTEFVGPADVYTHKLFYAILASPDEFSSHYAEVASVIFPHSTFEAPTAVSEPGVELEGDDQQNQKKADDNATSPSFKVSISLSWTVAVTCLSIVLAVVFGE
jgi:hypothetical protein